MIDLLDYPNTSSLMKAYIEQYAQIARDDVQGPIQDLALLELKAREDADSLGEVTQCRVLEIGPGLGHLAKILESRGAIVSLADLVPHYLELLREDVSGECYLADAQYPHWESRFDIIVLCDVLEHVFRPADLLLTCWKALVPGGRLYVRSPSNERLIHYAMQLSYPFELVHIRTYTPLLLKRELRAAGFSIEKGPKGIRNGPRTPRDIPLVNLKYWSHYRSSAESGLAAQNPAWFKVVDSLARGLAPSRLSWAETLTKPASLLLGAPLEVWAVGRRPHHTG